MTPTQPLSTAQVQQLQQQIAALQRYVTGPAATAIAKRAAFWSTLQAAGGELGAANVEADQQARGFALVVQGLNSGQLFLQPWAEPLERGIGPVRFAVASRDQRLGLWPLVVPALIVAGAVAVAAGGFVLADLYLTARNLEAEADKLRAQTAAATTQAVTQLAATDPVGATQLADALSRAQNAANNATPGWLDRLLQGARDLVPSSSGGAGLLLLLGAAWLYSQRKGGRA